MDYRFISHKVVQDFTSLKDITCRLVNSQYKVLASMVVYHRMTSFQQSQEHHHAVVKMVTDQTKASFPADLFFLPLTLCNSGVYMLKFREQILLKER